MADRARAETEGPPSPALEGVLRALVTGSWLVALSTVLATVMALLYLNWVPPRFTASMVIGPTARQGAAGMGVRLPPPVAGRLATAPVEFNDGEALSDFARFLHLLRSVPIAERLAEDDRILPGLFPAMWDATAGRWRPPDDPTARLKRWILGLAGRQGWAPPDTHALARHLRRHLGIEPVGDAPMWHITYRHADRAFALHLLHQAYRAADGELRREALRRSEAQIGHLRARLAQVTSAEHRAALAGQLTELERVAMMIEVDLPFSADLVTPPTAALLPDVPDPLVVVPTAALAGLMLGMAGVFARHAWQLHRIGG